MPKTNTKYTSQHIDNQSFDDALQVKVTELVNTSGTLVNPATEEKQDEIIGLTDFRYEVSGSTIYIGETNILGSADSDSTFRIQKIDTSTGKGTWADAVATYTKQWSNRSSYTY